MAAIGIRTRVTCARRPIAVPRNGGVAVGIGGGPTDGGPAIWRPPKPSPAGAPTWDRSGGALASCRPLSRSVDGAPAWARTGGGGAAATGEGAPLSRRRRTYSSPLIALVVYSTASWFSDFAHRSSAPARLTPRLHTGQMSMC